MGREEAEERALGLLARSREALADGNSGDAVKLLEEALRLPSLPVSLRTELSALRREGRAILFEDSVLRGTCQVVTPVVETGSPIGLEIHLHNPSEMRIDISSGSRRGFLGIRRSNPLRIEIAVDLLEIDPLGSRVLSEWRHVVEVQENLTLEGGATRTIRLELPTTGEAFSGDRLVYRRLTLSPEASPVVVEGEDELHIRALPFGSAEAEVFPRNYQRIASDARRFLEEALGDKSMRPEAPSILLLAAALHAHDDQEGCLRLLSGAPDLDPASAVGRARATALEIVSTPADPGSGGSESRR